ncbi:hypothetical protein OUZ56_010040 [Daphnia magna]|uniref:Uncharacterized protein n=1 Tax=Daphnia magna TaxID=35525 RepID=A0ABR0AHM5_9CRUS|nr:hypothetical protein OUZ56_010040 [Daphnia magna]
MADICGVTGLSFNIPSGKYQISVYVCQEQDLYVPYLQDQKSCNFTHKSSAFFKLGNKKFYKAVEHERRPRYLHKAFFYE